MLDLLKPLAELEEKWRKRAERYRQDEKEHLDDPRTIIHEWAIGYIHLEKCADELAAVTAQLEGEVANLENVCVGYHMGQEMAENQVAALEAELSKLRDQLARANELNAALLNENHKLKMNLVSETARDMIERLKQKVSLLTNQLAQQKAKEEIKTHPMGGVCPNCLQEIPK